MDTVYELALRTRGARLAGAAGGAGVVVEMTLLTQVLASMRVPSAAGGRFSTLLFNMEAKITLPDKKK